MTRHGEAHNAETEKSDFSHVYNLEFVGGVEFGRPDAGNKERGLLLALKQAPRKVWECHNKHRRLKGNGPIWRTGMVL
jgi:hypothetical protein